MLETVGVSLPASTISLKKVLYCTVNQRNNVTKAGTKGADSTHPPFLGAAKSGRNNLNK
jgi:hypothetical protein